MKPYRKFNPIQIRWGEYLGRPECPYLRRWVFNFYLFSIRIHHWMASDDQRYHHDHPWWYAVLVWKGAYYDVSPTAKKGIKWDWMPTGSIRFRKAEHKHYVVIPVNGEAWTLLITGKSKRHWGFWVKDRMIRPLRYFHKYGHPPCGEP